MRRSWPIRGAVHLTLLGATIGCSRPPSQADATRCAELGSGTLSSSAVTVLIGSRLSEDRKLIGGRAPGYHADAGATRAFVNAHAAVEMLPAELPVAHAVVHWLPVCEAEVAASTPLETHRESGAMVVTDSLGADLHPTVWLHELGHVMMRGRRPVGWAARRFGHALEEGVADYLAATVSGSPRIGDARLGRQGRRDLTQPPRLTALHWASIGMRNAPFDPHEYGWSLAAKLYQMQSRPSPLLEDLVACLATGEALARASASPAAVVAGLLDDCPARSRSIIEAVLREWLPEPLRPGSNPGALGEQQGKSYT